jgi:DNA polymerase III, alpha subunit
MIQLRVRTEYSFGQTYAPLDRVMARLKAIGCTAAGMVDSTTWGHVEWVKACTKAGIQPLLGVQCIVTEANGLAPTRMWFLAKSTKGLGELYRAFSFAHTNRLGPHPRMTRYDVRAMSEEILKFAGDVTDGQWLSEIGAYLDLNPTSLVLNAEKLRIAAGHQDLLVYTSDNAYAFPEDAAIFECISRAGLRTTPQYVLETFPMDCAATRTIAKACEGLALPKAPMISVPGDLTALCRKGIKTRKMKWTKEYETRLVYELDLIKSKNYESYFLIVADMVQYAKLRMLVGPSRGSAAGSLVCYLTAITEIDPIQAGLYFERFIDVTRTDLPDIDLDFPDTKREQVFTYMTTKYGQDNVARIGNVVTFAAKSALIHVSKALNVPPWAIDGVKTAMIDRSSADARAERCLEDTLTSTQPGKDFSKTYPAVATIAAAIEGHVQHTSVHAAGLLVSTDALRNYATIDEEGIAHIEKSAAEHLGLLKIDVLGLRTLTILEDAGVPIDWYDLTFDDPKTLAVFQRMKLCGIFQFEGETQRSITKLMQVQSLNDIDVLTALSRPGPLAGGVTYEYLRRRKTPVYQAIHPLVATHMEQTLGLPIYQEQTLAIVRYIGQFSWADTAQIRKAMSKSLGVEFFNTYWPTFLKGATAQGIDDAEARRVWEMICTMGSWQMNKAHTYSYAVISYWCAYLKAHHPLQFAASNLRHAHDEDQAVNLLREITDEGIQYVAFDPDKSELDWSIKGKTLYGGYLALKGIGPKKAEKYLALRKAKQLTNADRAELKAMPSPFHDIYPLHTKYKDWYTNPAAHGVSREITTIAEIMKGVPHGEQRVFLATMIRKNPHSLNEEANIKKRGGKVEVPPLEYLDLRLRDDTDAIIAKVDRWKYPEVGLPIVESVPEGAHLLIRATFWHRGGAEFIPCAFIEAWRRVDQ